jgi:small conductance mechanosensitive channel
MPKFYLMEEYFEKFKTMLLDHAPSVLSALAILIIGMYAIKIIVKATRQLMKKGGVDLTLQSFLGNLIGWTLKALLFITVISKLGVATTSFATIIGAAGLAVGLALQGSLSNFAGGALIMIFKPFKIHDLIEAQGTLGVVKEIQIFTTEIKTPDNKLVIIPNGALSNGTIINYSKEGILRIDLTFGVSYDANIKQTKEVLMTVLNTHPKVLEDPLPAVTVSELADSSVNFAVRPWVQVEDYWEVYFDITEQTKLALDTAGIEIPYPHRININK